MTSPISPTRCTATLPRSKTSESRRKSGSQRGDRSASVRDASDLAPTRCRHPEQGSLSEFCSLDNALATLDKRLPTVLKAIGRVCQEERRGEGKTGCSERASLQTERRLTSSAASSPAGSRTDLRTRILYRLCQEPARRKCEGIEENGMKKLTGRSVSVALNDYAAGGPNRG